MKKSNLIPILCVALLLTGCNKQAPKDDNASFLAHNLMEDYKPAKMPETEPDADFQKQQMNFAISLFQQATEDTDENVLISPLSVTQALAMTANGAAGKTLSQMEDVLSGEKSIVEYSQMLSAYVHHSEGKQLISANSIWLDESRAVKIKPEFLQKNADYFGADVFCTDFWATDCHNQIAVEQMNNWVWRNTNEQIPRMLEQINPNAIMVLLNAVTFDAEWQTPYKDNVTNRTFTDVHGIEQTAQMMHGEDYYYITDGAAVGFIKDYADEQFCFAALVPGEGTDIAEYIAGMNAENLLEALQNPEQITVFTSMPRFTASYDVQLGEHLQALGMSDAFEAGAANFSEMAQSENGNIYIGEMLHKSTIVVDTQGTKAAAATAVVMTEGAALVEEFREVDLDRPFVYLILDKAQMLPVFIGMVNELETPSE